MNESSFWAFDSYALDFVPDLADLRRLDGPFILRSWRKCQRIKSLTSSASFAVVRPSTCGAWLLSICVGISDLFWGFGMWLLFETADVYERAGKTGFSIGSDGFWVRN